MNEAKHLQSVLNNKDFLVMDISKQKEYVINSLELDLMMKLSNLGVKTKMSYDVYDIFEIVAKSGNDEFLNNIYKTLLKIMSIMQKNEISLKQGISSTKCDLKTVQFVRLGEKPVSSYDINGRLLGIEYSSKMSVANMTFDLINQFENRFLVPYDLTRKYKMSSN